MRPSSVVVRLSVEPVFLDQINYQIRGKGTYSSYLQTFFFSKMLFSFISYEISLTWDHMEEKFQTTSPLKVHNRFTPPKSCIVLGRVCTKIVQGIVKFKILDVL